MVDRRNGVMYDFLSEGMTGDGKKNLGYIYIYI